jgi:hypothetical protein
MADETSPILEKRLMLELSIINTKLRELELEKLSLERLLVRVRREDVANYEVGRKNSAKRLLVEKAVLNRLAAANGKSVTSNDLWLAANNIELRLNPSTFRSYLHRMKEKGMIETGYLYGRWKLPSPSEGEGSSDVK